MTTYRHLGMARYLTTDEVALLLKDAMLAMEAWGAEEDGIPVLFSLGSDIDPWGVYLRLGMALCRMSPEQRCHTCADRECCDNTTPEGMP